MGENDRLDTPDRDESDVTLPGGLRTSRSSGLPPTDEEREELRRERLAAVRLPVGAR